MMNELQALKSVDFDWAMHLRSIWSNPPCDVPQVHGELRAELAQRLDTLNADGRPESPLGWPLTGSGGVGKTHLLSVLRRMAFDRRMAFVLIDMTDVHDFWEMVLLGYLSSLQQECTPGRFQYQIILERFLNALQPTEPAAWILRKLERAKTRHLVESSRKMLTAISRTYPQKAREHQDVIRALIALNSEDLDISGTGLTWLQGHPIEEEARTALGFTVSHRRPREIVEALSWLMSLAGPTVLAFDQLDPIVSYLKIASGEPDSGATIEEVRVARSIIEQIAAELAAIREKTTRTLIVVSCLETTWHQLTELVVLKTTLERYEPPKRLRPIDRREAAEGILLSRLAPAYQRAGFSPPYPTWPFRPEAFEGMQGVSPRQILKFGYEHLRRCIDQGQVTELVRFGEVTPPAAPAKPDDRFAPLDAQLLQYRQAAPLEELLEERADDDRLAPLVQTTCRCLVRESRLPIDVEAVVDSEFPGGKTTRPLHARIRLIHHAQDEREEHFCLRALERKNANAFQARLNAAITQAGIDRRLGFRHLAVLRRSALPSGQVTSRLIEKFGQSGGLFLKPSDEELGTMWALWQLEQQGHPDFLAWIRERRPASQLAIARSAIGDLSRDGSPAGTPDTIVDVPKPARDAEPQPIAASRPGVERRSPAVSPTSCPAAAVAPTVPPAVPASALRELTLGWRWIGERAIEPVRMPVAGLEKHAVILAGAGSGKTVLIRRLVEEVALLGIPSLVIDCANDLATLGDRWPEVPAGWRDEDRAKADSYFANTEVLVWTPGRQAGNPLSLEPLPDLAAVADDEDELQASVDMVVESLLKIVAPGAGTTTQVRKGILSAALRYYAGRGGGPLSSFVPFLRELPVGAGIGAQNEAKLARDMADRLKAELETNVLLRDSGASLDPALLFGDSRGDQKVRISVVNFVGLPGLDAQRQFLNQLAMTLFSWIKKNPVPPGRPLRGLLVIDEAKDFVPSQSAAVCKPSLMRLVAQARKYHLGLVLATQNPKEIENTVIGNCSTHFYGKAGSPEAIRIIREQIHLRGGGGDDTPTLPTGTFYVYNADAKMPSPLKVRVPMCVSRHPASPLQEAEILRRADGSRRLLSARNR